MSELIDEAGDERIRTAIHGETVPRLLRATVAERGDEAALRWKVGEGWETSSWNRYADDAARTATILQNCGVRHGDRVALMMRNRPEFHPIDMGASLVGAVPFSMYNSSSPEQLEYLLTHSEARLVVVESFFADTIRPVISRLANPIPVVIVDGPVEGDELSWDSELRNVEPDDFDAACDRVQPSDLATLIYTSGTTGPPKAVMLTHSNICWLLHSLVETLDIELAGARMLSYLPMAHVAERIFTHYLPAKEGALVTPCPDPAAVGSYLVDVRPQAFFGPPRVFDKMRAGLLRAFSSSPDAAARLERGVELGDQLREARVQQVEAPADVIAEWQAINADMLSGIRAQVGLDACQVALTGAAPAPVEVIKFFNAIGLTLTECYGLSEDTGLLTIEPKTPIPGTVGRPIPGCSIRLLDDGEILCRGGHLFSGYYRDPDSTAEALDADGWLHTGDIGRIRPDGYLEIIDRKKELIITAGGKNISPANIEAKLKSQRLIGDACVIGDTRPYVTAILTVDAEGLGGWAREQGLDSLSVDDLVTRAEFRAQFDADLESVNQQLSNVERIKKYHLSTDEWVPDSDILTPTMKLKRRGVLARYQAEIDALYEEVN